MSNKAKEITENEEIVVTADKGYDSAKEIKKCSDANIEVIVPIKDNLKAQKDKNKFTRESFIYDNLTDTYCCPNKHLLTEVTQTKKQL
jgi:hypothetical protein